MFLVTPVELARRNLKMRTSVVEPVIPLLFSKISMKNASMVTSFVEDLVVVFGQRLKLITTASWFHTFPLFQAQTEERVHDVLMMHGKVHMAKK